MLDNYARDRFRRLVPAWALPMHLTNRRAAAAAATSAGARGGSTNAAAAADGAAAGVALQTRSRTRSFPRYSRVDTRAGDRALAV